jgi:hypothetical protein
MNLFFAALPIVFLIFVMTKKNGLPSTVAFALAALIAYGVRIWFFGASPNLANAAVVSGLLDALTPISIVFGAIFFFVALEKVGSSERIAGVASRDFEQPRGATHGGWMGICLPHRGRLRLRNSRGAGSSDAGRAWVSAYERGVAVPYF